MSDSDNEDDGSTPAERAAAARAALTARALRFFRRLPFFDSTPLSALECLAAAAQHYTVGRDEVVVQQGAPCEDGLFFIRKGSFRVIQELPIYARAVDEAQAAKEFVLPPLSIEAAEAQRKRNEAAAERHQQRLLSGLGPSPYSSQSSIHSSAATFLTAQSRSARSLGASSTSAAPSASSHGAIAPPLHSHLQNSSMHSIHEHVPTSPRRGDADFANEYFELSAYEDDHHRSRQSTLASRKQQPLPSSSSSDLLAAPAAAMPAVPPPATQSILIGSRFLEVGDLGPYCVFGEVGVMLRCARSASVVSRSSGGELFAITQFDFLRLQTRKALHALRLQAEGAYRSAAELTLELDDTVQWDHYKAHMLLLSKDRNIKSHKLTQMPIFESLPVHAFEIKLPKLQSTESKTAASLSSSYPTAAAVSSSAAASSSPPPLASRHLSYSDGRDLNIVERYSSKRGATTNAATSNSSTTGARTERSKKGTTRAGDNTAR